MIRQLSVWMVFVSLGVALAGCGQAKPPAPPAMSITPTADHPAPPPPTKNQIAEVPAAKASKTSSLVATAAEGSAEATFQQTLVAFQEGRLDKIFDLLPASYQADVENVVHEFAEKMDSELWSKSFRLLTRIANILQTKKSLILNLDNVKRTPQIESIRNHWDSVVSGFYEVTTSEVADINNLKQCSVQRLLGLASQLLNEKGMPLPQFGDVTVTTVESNTETATLSYRESKDSEPKQVEFVKIEGKWLPKTIASSWADTITTIKAKLADLPGIVSSVKPIIIQQMEGVNGILEQIEQAKTPEQFNGAIMPLVMSVALGKGLIEQSMRDAESRPRKANAVFVVVTRELSDGEQTRFKEAVLAAIDDENLEYEIIPNDGKTRFRFTPVPNSDVILRVIEKHFDGATMTQDSETKTIRVELK